MSARSSSLGWRQTRWLLIADTKAKFDNLPTAFLNQLKEEISNGP
jgi:hypothetical protein